MLVWAKIVLIVLQLAETLISFLQKQGYIEEGYQKAVAEANARMLRNNKYAQDIMQRISKLSADDTDKLLREFEP